MKTYKTGIGKQIERYLIEKANNGEPIPNATGISREFNLASSTTSYILKKLAKENKIRYSKGKILSVLISQANATNERAFKSVTREQILTKDQWKVKYNDAVKDVIASYIKKLPIENINGADIQRTVDFILNVSNNIKSKLF